MKPILKLTIATILAAMMTCPAWGQVKKDTAKSCRALIDSAILSKSPLFFHVHETTLTSIPLYRWITFAYPNLPEWSMDDPDKTKKYTLHIKRKYLHWLNDSTAVYTFKQFKQK